MPTDEFHLRRTAQYLQSLMRELEAMKGKRTIPQRTERVMKPTPGPRAPGNITAISLHAEIEKELQHWIGTLSNPQLPAPRSAHGILGWVAFHAYDIAQQTDGAFVLCVFLGVPWWVVGFEGESVEVLGGFSPSGFSAFGAG